MLTNEISQDLKNELYARASEQFAQLEVSALNFSDEERMPIVAGACGCCKPSNSPIEQV